MRRFMESMAALKQEALLWRERALQVVRQNSVFVRQQLMRPEASPFGAMGHAPKSLRSPAAARCCS